MQSLRNTTIILTSIFILSFPAPGQSAPVSGGTMVGGECYSGPIATPGDVSSAADWVTATLDQTIKYVGTVLEDKIVTQTKLQKEMHENEMKTLRDLLVGFGAAQERARAQDQFGELSRPNMACDGQELGAGIQVGKKAEKLVAADYLTRSAIHNLGIDQKNEQLSRQWLNSLEEQRLSAESLMPTTGAFKTDEDLKAARDLTFVLTNPYPSPAKAPTSAAASAYEAQRRLKQARLALPQKALSEIVAARAPVIELGAWAKDTWEKAGGEGEPMGVVNGKISATGLIDLLVDARFGNPNWYDSLNEMNSLGLQREQLHLQVAQMEMMRRTMRMLEMLVALEAQRAGTEILELDNASLNVLDAQSESKRIE